MFFEILFTQFFCVAIGASNATLEVDPAMARDTSSFITCSSGNNITRGVLFYTDNGIPQGGCSIPGALCQSSVQGYSVTQNVTSRTTTLIIDSVNCTRETGSWYCRHGTDLPSPEVYIGCNTTKYAPSINESILPSTLITVKGKQLFIDCATSTTPGRPSSTSYIWTYPNGSSTSGSTLQVNSVDTSDAGQYTCRASNNFSSSQHGQNSANLQLTVQFAPTVSDQDSSYQVTESSHLEIDCRNYTTVGNPSSSGYIWTGPKSFSLSQPILSISNISRNQAGTYTCRANNTLTPTGKSAESGIGEGNFSVDVQYGPDANMVNLTKPSVIAEKNDVTLTCSTLTTVNPGVEFTWSWGDNTTISAGLGNKQGVARGSWSQTLTVNASRDSNRQEIRCDVINTQTSKNERVVVDLDVSYGPDSGEVQISKSSTAVELEPLGLTCSTTNNVKPRVNFTWTVDGLEVTSGTGVTQGSSGSNWSQTLMLTPNRNQSSVRCTVINTAIARLENSSVDLDVNYPPDISLHPVVGPQNTNLTLNCTATGNPRNFSFEYFRQYWGDQLIQRRGGTQTGDRYSLDLPQVSYQDSGVYVCTVSNNVKQPSHKNTTLSVQASAVYTKDTNPTDPIGAEVGHTARLVQYVYCSPNITSVSWHFNTTNTSTVKLSTDSSNVSSSPVHLDVYGTQVEVAGFKLVYTVTNFTKEHVGLYTVRVCNSVGSAESSQKVIASGPPVTPLDLSALNSTTDSVTLTWTPQYAGGDYTQEFLVEFRVQNTSGAWNSRVFHLSKDNSGAGVVDGLDSNTGYVFRIKSVTDRRTGNNTSQVSEEIYFSTKGETIVPPGPALPVGGIVGGIVGGVACFILVAVLLVFLRRRKQSKGRDRERLGSNGRNGEIVMSGVGGVTARATENAGVTYAEVKKKKPVTDVYTEVKKPNKRRQKKDDVYETAVPRQYGDDANTYANAGFVGDEPEAKNENPQPPTGRDADGCLYVGIDFGNQKPSKVIIGKEKGSYVDIAYGKVGLPPPPDEDEEDDEKKKK